MLQWDRDHVRYNFDLRKGPVGMEFFKGGKTNVCYNALDRHVKLGSGERACFLWEGNEPGVELEMTYRQVLEETCRLVSPPLTKRDCHVPDSAEAFCSPHLLCSRSTSVLASLTQRGTNVHQWMNQFQFNNLHHVRCWGLQAGRCYQPCREHERFGVA